MKYKTVTESIVFPCDISFVKDQLRITHTAQDSYITSLIKAATAYANDFTGRQLNYATLQAFAQYNEKDFYNIDRGPVGAISNIEYLNTSGALVEIPAHTVSVKGYTIFKYQFSAVIYIDDEFEFADVDTTREDAIRITYTAGYGGAHEGNVPFPETVKNAVAMKAARMYTNPDDQVDEKYSISDNLLRGMRCPII